MHVSPHDLAHRLGMPLDQATLLPTASFASQIRIGRVPPEWAARIVEHGPAPLTDLLGRAAPVDGAAGLLWALYAAGALRLERAKPVGRDASPPPRALMSSWLTRARRRPHHEVLGVEPSASARCAIQAGEERLAELDALSAPKSDEATWARWKSEIREAIEEAVAVLSDPELAEAYRRALRQGSDEFQ